QFQPARDRYRIFIIDEAHMLSSGAWNALLKLIEEPPPHVIFMFATTEINKVPQTIISRVQREMLRKVSLDDLIKRLGEIAKAEEITIDRAALDIVARRGEGSVRDSLSLLDQVIAFAGRNIAAVDVATVLGLSDTNFFSRIVSLIADGNHGGILEALQEASETGRDFRMLYRDLLNFIRNLLLLAGGAKSSMLAVSPEDVVAIENSVDQFSYSELLRIANLLLRDDETVNKAEHQRLAVEIALLKAATLPRLRAVEEVLSGAPLPSGAARTATIQPRPAAPQAAKKEAAAVGGGAPQKAGDVNAFVQKIQSTRPLVGQYLAGAKSHAREGNRITFTFEAADSFYADHLKDEASSLEKTAAEIFGEPVKLDFRVESAAPTPARRAEDAPSPLREDPVVKAFAKHLGGEVVEPRKRQEKP
ncbi:MAG TPA: hypothetical protein VF698_00255, partial [Thermoanaerobaculia bacterium]